MSKHYELCQYYDLNAAYGRTLAGCAEIADTLVYLYGGDSDAWMDVAACLAHSAKLHKIGIREMRECVNCAVVVDPESIMKHGIVRFIHGALHVSGGDIEAFRFVCQACFMPGRFALEPLLLFAKKMRGGEQ